MRDGLKRVRERRNDVLAGEGWARLEQLLADYYRRQGYDVEHCGTGGRASRFDGGVDLRLRRGSDIIVVQCKHWNAYKVPHNEVHQLLGIMVNEQASGAILVTSGEFTKAAIEAAGRHGHVQLVDGDDLREMLGPQIGGAGAGYGQQERKSNLSGSAGTFGSYAAERLIAAAEYRIRGGGNRRKGSIVASAAWTGLAAILLKLGLALALLYFGSMYLQGAIRNIASPKPPAFQTQQVRPQATAATISPHRRQLQTPAAPVIHQSSPQELEAWNRRNAESMEILRESTPELPEDPRRR